MTSQNYNADDVRRLILDVSFRAGVGHIGSSLSIVDILHVLYASVINRDVADERERDRFILSKGHAALALYAVLHLEGKLTREALHGYCQDASLLGVHPDHLIEGVDFSTGALGHGLGMGAALAARLRGSPRRVFVLLSDQSGPETFRMDIASSCRLRK